MQPKPYRPSSEIWIMLLIVVLFLLVVGIYEGCEQFHASLPGWVCQPR